MGRIVTNWEEFCAEHPHLVSEFTVYRRLYFVLHALLEALDDFELVQARFGRILMDLQHLHGSLNNAGTNEAEE